MGKVLKGGLIVIIVIIFFWVAVSAYANIRGFTKTNTSTQIATPSSNQAQYQIVQASTGNVLCLTNSYFWIENKILVVDGYYEVSGKKYVYHKAQLPLDTATFGPLVVQKVYPQ